MTQTKQPRRRQKLPAGQRPLSREAQDAQKQALIALLESWIAEDAAGDPAEQAADWEDLKAALNANRPADRPLFV